MRPRDFRCDMQAQTQTVLQAFVSAKKRLEQPFERFGWDWLSPVGNRDHQIVLCSLGIHLYRQILRAMGQRVPEEVGKELPNSCGRSRSAHRFRNAP